MKTAIYNINIYPDKLQNYKSSLNVYYSAWTLVSHFI